jgi:hypothetical protein
MGQYHNPVTAHEIHSLPRLLHPDNSASIILRGIRSGDLFMDYQGFLPWWLRYFQPIDTDSGCLDLL